MQGHAVIGDQLIRLQEGDSVFIEKGQKHRLISHKDSFLEIVEIQTGSYFGEDDIVRYEDDFGRISSS